LVEDSFYENEKVIHEVVESRRSKLCYKLIMDLLCVMISSGKSRKSARILDVGCGDGSFISQFKGDCNVFGVDISSRAIRKAKEAGIIAYKVDVSCEKLHFKEGYFDIVYMGDIIEHLTDPDFAVQEVKRVLKKDHFLVLSTPNLACWYNRLLLLLGFQPVFSEVSTAKLFGGVRTASNAFPVGHLRLFTLKALKEFLNFHGFKVVVIKGAFHERLPRPVKAVDVISSKIPSLSSILIGVAKKK